MARRVATLFGGQLGGNPTRIPDIVVQPAPGVVYAAPNAKLVDHGSGSAEDTHVPLVVVDPSATAATRSAARCHCARSRRPS